jgi:hypothetical protein
MRIATKQHKSITLTSATLSCSFVGHPGQRDQRAEAEGQSLPPRRTLIHYRSSDVHSTGHGNTGELVWINKQVNAKFFMPATATAR